MEDLKVLEQQMNQSSVPKKTTQPPATLEPETMAEPIPAPQHVPCPSAQEAPAAQQASAAAVPEAQTTRQTTAEPSPKQVNFATPSSGEKPAAQTESAPASRQQVTCVLNELANLSAGQKAISSTLAQMSCQSVSASTSVDTGILQSRLEACEKTMSELKEKNMSALRQFMDFVQGNGRKMNTELDRYHKMFENSIHDPIWRGLAEIYHAILRLADAHPGLREELEWDVLEPLQELLEGYGVTLHESQTGARRSMMRTHSTSQVPTADPTLNACVARSVRPGFLRDGIVLVKEEVESYVYDPNLVSREAEQASADAPPAEEAATEDENPALEESHVPEAPEPQTDSNTVTESL